MSEPTRPAAKRPPPPDPNSPAFVKAVTQLGERQSVVTARAIYNHQGTKLLEGGVQINAQLYDRLVAHRLATPLDEDLDSAATVDSTMLRGAVEAALARWPFFALMAPAGRVRGMLMQAIDAIPLPRPVAFHLTLARETRRALFDHGVLMAILAAHLVREGGAPIHDMTMAAAAGLLHDLGMLHIDADLLASANRLDGDDRRPLYVHPVTSSMLIARFHEYPNEVSRAILEHHELLDGSGYPRALTGDAISPLGRLMSLCEVVTAMFDGEREHPERRVSLLLRMTPQRFDAALVPSIHRLVRDSPHPASQDVGLPIGAAIAELRPMADLLTGLHTLTTTIAPTLDAATHAVLSAVSDQAETLRRALFEAGITDDQLALLEHSADSVDRAEGDAALRAELWALNRELHWHLGAHANQLRRRWRSASGEQPLPEPLAAWVREVEGLSAAR